MIGKTALHVLLALTLGSCGVHVDTTQLFARESYEERIEEVLAVDEGEAISFSGTVTHTEVGCKGGPENCHLVVEVESVPINVYYLFNPQGEDCLNDTAAEDAARLSNGDVIEVKGLYYGLGTVSTCPSEDFYIREIADQD